ncbi:unnamed protein product [Amoebophrya sp. A120]|nr:unnamed protein product [Amoebophrya sp. A120]|eukprot:GSA120T00011741001.1
MSSMKISAMKIVSPMKVYASAMKLSSTKMSSMKMSAMKASMKMGLKKMAMKKSTVARGRNRQAVVFHGHKLTTSGGLKKSDLKKNAQGKIVSVKKSAAAKKKATFAKISSWGASLGKARKEMGLKGFICCGGKTALGQALLARTRAIYKQSTQ